MKRLLWLFMLGLGLILAVPTTGGATTVEPPALSVDLIKVQGLIDPALAGYVRGVIESSERLGATVILQIDSLGSFGNQEFELGRFIRNATVPVVAWIGPSGARAASGALFVVYSSSLVAMAPGAGVGPGRPFDLATTASSESSAQVARDTVGLAATAQSAGVPPPSR